MYEHLGYVLYRRIVDYYSSGDEGDEDAFGELSDDDWWWLIDDDNVTYADMRKSLARDPTGEHMKPQAAPVDYT